MSNFIVEDNKVRELIMSNSSGIFQRPTPSRYFRIPKRYTLSILMGVAMFILYWMRTNFSTAIVHYLLKQRYSDTLFPDENQWTFEDIAMMDSAYYWGYAAGHIPGALLVISWSAHKSLVTTMALSSIIHLTLPLALNHHATAVVVMNVLQGFVEGPALTACFVLLLYWSPSNERSRQLSFIISGACLGFLVGVPFSNFLIDYMGEEIGFFSASFGGMIWCGVWSIYAFASPSEDPYITHKELSFLEEHTDKELKTPPTLSSIPFKGILKSFPVYAIGAASACFEIDTIIAHWVPLFNIPHDLDLEDVVFSLHVYAPKFILALAVLISGVTSDFIVSKGLMGVGATRKAITCSGLSCYGILIIISSQIHKGSEVIALQHISTAFLGLSAIGYATNCFDICPRYVCVIVGLYKTISSVAAIVFSVMIEKLMDFSISNTKGWNTLLSVIGGINLAIAILYCIFSSGVRQEWDENKVDLEEIKSSKDSRCYPDCSTDESRELVDECTAA